MVIVLISARYKSILNWIKEEKSQDIYSIEVIKQNGVKVFLYIDTKLSKQGVIKHFHSVIERKCYGALVYEFYEIYNGKIDFHPYLSESSKDQMKYYQSDNKDISDREVIRYIDKL